MKKIYSILSILILGVSLIGLTGIKSDAITKSILYAEVKGTMTYDKNSSGIVSGARNLSVVKNPYLGPLIGYTNYTKSASRYNSNKYYRMNTNGRYYDINDGRGWMIDRTINGFN